eukprot:GHVP01021539.1.p2 GENE.GHVP01021539.1~~GHVP01021539.1.p2  ORF type:complete len:122 (-),score=12.09 GHVP01021539.1:118-483(-)
MIERWSYGEIYDSGLVLEYNYGSSFVCTHPAQYTSMLRALREKCRFQQKLILLKASTSTLQREMTQLSVSSAQFLPHQKKQGDQQSPSYTQCCLKPRHQIPAGEETPDSGLLQQRNRDLWQ